MMRVFLIIIAFLCVLAMFLGLLRAFAVPFGYSTFTEKLFKCFKCDEVCIWMVIIIGAIGAGFFAWLASKCQNGK